MSEKPSSYGQFDKKELWTIPNIITYFRFLCVPVFVVLMAFAGIYANMSFFYAAFGVFVVAAASDLVDGWIARRFNMQSGVGMIMDPFADKLLHISVLFCLSLCTGLTALGVKYPDVSGSPWFVHYAFVILILVKELIMICVAPVVAKKGVKVKANWLGKIASATLSLGIILSFFHPYLYYADWGILAWGVAQSYAAAVNYLVDILKQLKMIKRGEMKAYSPESIKEEDMEIVREKKTGADISEAE
jgi:phosphatidylglycerophosphate synthase